MTDCTESWFRERTNLWIVPFEQAQSLKQEGNTDIFENYRNQKIHKLVAVENITPGDYIIMHNRKLGQVIEKVHKKYQGVITGISHLKSDKTLYLCGSHRVLAKEISISTTGDNFWKLFPVELYKKIKVNNKNNNKESGILWEYVQNEQMGVPFIRDYRIGPFIADFYSEERKIIIEIDDEPITKQSLNYRNLMDSFFKSKGITVLRYGQDDILIDLPNTLRHIRSILLQRISSSFRGKDWVRADSLEIGDFIFYGIAQNPVKIKEIDYEEINETLIGIRIDRQGSCITEVATVYCPSVIELL